MMTPRSFSRSAGIASKDCGGRMADDDVRARQIDFDDAAKSGGARGFAAGQDRTGGNDPCAVDAAMQHPEMLDRAGYSLPHGILVGHIGSQDDRIRFRAGEGGRCVEVESGDSPATLQNFSGGHGRPKPEAAPVTRKTLSRINIERAALRM